MFLPCFLLELLNKVGVFFLIRICCMAVIWKVNQMKKRYLQMLAKIKHNFVGVKIKEILRVPLQINNI